MKQIYSFSFILILFLIAGCTGSEETINEAMEEYSGKYLEESLPANLSLETLRTSLSDVYSSRNNEVPERFARIKVEKKVERDVNEGYRVQIYSGQNVDDADTIAADFKAWSDTTITGYQADTYVFFRTPYYKVHIGDFHDRDRANAFSNIVKREFKDAWVVYDRVEPAKVPADTVNISTK